MSQLNPSVTTEAPAPPVPSGATPNPVAAPKISWKQYVADFVNAPRQAKAALIGSLMLVAISPSAMSALTPYVVPAYAMKTGATPSHGILLFVTVPLVIGPLLLPAVGRWVDRQGARRVAIPAVILYALITAAIPLGAGRTWLLETLLVLASVFGFAASLGVVFKIISTWFPGHRGIGFGLVGVTSSLASAALSPVLQWLVNGNAPAGPPSGAKLPSAPPAGMPSGGKPPVSAVDPGVFTGLGWDGVYYVIAIAIAVVGIPAALWLISEPKVSAFAGPRLLEAHLPGVPFRRAVRTRAFVFIVLLLTLASTGPIAIRQNAVDFFGHDGIDAATVSLGLSVLFTTSVVGLLVSGTVLDHARHPWVVAVLIATVPIGLVLALVNGGSLVLFFVALALLGFATGVESAIGPALIARYLGLKSFGALQGLMLAVTGAALALAPYGVSAIKDASGSYTVPLLVLLGLTGIGVVLAVLLPRYPRPWVLKVSAEDAVPGQPTTAP
jgi:MFS family permease